MSKARSEGSRARRPLELVRQDALLAEIRGLLSRGEATARRMRRLESMEHAARVWVNGEALGPQPKHAHLYETYD